MAVGSGEFEVAGDAGDGKEAVLVWAVRNGLPDDYRHGLLPATGSGCALRRSSSGANWGTTRTVPHTSSPGRASDTGWRRVSSVNYLRRPVASQIALPDDVTENSTAAGTPVTGGAGRLLSVLGFWGGSEIIGVKGIGLACFLSFFVPSRQFRLQLPDPGLGRQPAFFRNSFIAPSHCRPSRCGGVG